VREIAAKPPQPTPREPVTREWRSYTICIVVVGSFSLSMLLAGLLAAALMLALLAWLISAAQRQGMGTTNPPRGSGAGPRDPRLRRKP